MNSLISKTAQGRRATAQLVSGLVLVTFLGWPTLPIAAPSNNPVTQAWAAQIRGPTNSYFQTADMALDTGGDVFVVGNGRRGQWDYDIILSRHNSAGAMVWQTRYDPGNGSSLDEFSQAVVMRGTNLYLAGKTVNARGDQDVLTLKYRDTGALEWAVSYDGLGNSTDLPVSITVDGEGNVIVAADSIGVNSTWDLAVLKYDPLGNLRWAYRYDGPAHYPDRVAGLRLDADGNILLAGTSDETAGKPGVVTVKLDPAGQELWMRRESSSDTGGLTAQDLDLDPSGNVIVLGEERSHCVTWKYGSAGNRLWASRYRAEEPAAMYAAYVRCDHDANVIVAANLYGSGTNDTVLVKYAPDGRQLWATRIADPGGVVHVQDLELDASGSAYLTATPTSDALTVKVGADGTQLWAISYNSGGSFHDYGQFLKLDASGNVFVAGRSGYGADAFVSLVKYTQQDVAGLPIASVSPALQVVELGTNVVFTGAATGTQPIQYQWRMNGRALPGATESSLALTNVQAFHSGDYSLVVANLAGTTVSSEARLTVRVPPEVLIAPTAATEYRGTDTAFIATVSGNDFTTLQWRHNGIDIPGATNEVLFLTNLTAAAAGAYAVVVITQGGTVTSSTAGLKVSSAVQLAGVTSYRSDAPESIWAPSWSVRVLPSGESIVAEHISNSTDGAGIMVRKLDPAGAVLWSTAFHSPGTAEPQPSGMALDAAQNIYVTGISGQPYSNSVAVLLKFSPVGQLQWARYLAETNHSGGMILDSAVDPAGNTTIGTFGFHGTALVRYSSAGELQWTIHDPSRVTDSLDVAVDSLGNSYFGATVWTDTGTEMRLRKLDTSGTVLWTQSVVEGVYSHLSSLAVDGDGNLVVAGIANVDLFPDTAVLVLKYAPDGNRIWRTSMGGNGAETRSVSAMAVGVEGDITVVALSDDDYEPEHTSIFRLGRDGQVRYRFRESPIYFSSPSQLAVDDFGNAYITGHGGRPWTGVDVMTAKYDSRGTRQWRVYYGGTAQVWEYGAAVGVDARGDIRVLAVADTLPGSGVELTLLHYVQADPAGTFKVQVVPDAAGTFHLTAPVGETFQIESSTDLRDWTAVSTNEAQRLLQPGGTPFSQTPHRFFRLLRTE